MSAGAVDEELEERLEPGDEFVDAGDEPFYDFSRIDRELLTHPVVVRAMAGVIVAGCVLLWPERTDRVIARIISVAVIALSLFAISRLVRGRGSGSAPDRRIIALQLGGALVAIGLAGFILLAGDRSDDAFARLAGLFLGGLGVRDLVLARRREDARAWHALEALGLIAVAALLLAFPSALFTMITVIVAIGFAVIGLFAISESLRPDTPDVVSFSGATELIWTWLEDRPKDADDRRQLYDKILYDGPTTSRRIVRFATLMAFASVIASMGIVADSTAVVIGAMLIAPLMTPLMGMAISLVMGWPRRLARSATVAAGGIALAIVIGVILGLVAPAVIDTATNSQITSRSTPTILDLITAVAAGAAGAYGLSRPDVSDSLPGVAIAISLVPPLSTVGIAYSQTDWNAGNGALILFATNMLAILIVGGLTFIVTGVTPLARIAENQHRIRTWLGTLGIAAALVVGALLLNGAEITADALRQTTADDEVADWLEEAANHDLVEVVVRGDEVTAVIVGPSEGRPDAADLADRLADAFDREITVRVRLIVEETDVATSGG